MDCVKFVKDLNNNLRVCVCCGGRESSQMGANNTYFQLGFCELSLSLSDSSSSSILYIS